MGTVTAPVKGSGACPSWMARVAKPGCLFFFMIFNNETAFIAEGAKKSRGERGEARLGPTLKNLFRQIALGRIRNDRRYSFARAQPARHLQRREHRRSRA